METKRTIERKKPSIAVTVRVTPEGKEIWDKLAERMGINRTATLELLLRETAERRGMRDPSP